MSLPLRSASGGQVIGSTATIFLLLCVFVLAYRRATAARAENARLLLSSRDEAVTDPLTDSGDVADVWVNMLVRGRALVSVQGDTRLKAGDELLISAEERWHSRLEALFRQ